MADTVELCEALREALAAGAFSLPIVVSRVYVPTFTIADLAQRTQVTVAPTAITRVALSRAHRQVERDVEVSINQRVSAIDTDAIDALVDLTDEIADFLDAKHLGTPPIYYWQRTEIQPYDLEALHSKNIYAALLVPHYQVVRTP